MTAPYITVTPTVMDGTVVRWFTNQRDMDRCQAAISASRRGVLSDGYITPELFDPAWAAHLALKAGVDVEHLATHRHQGITGPFVPVEPVTA